LNGTILLARSLLSTWLQPVEFAQPVVRGDSIIRHCLVCAHDFIDSTWTCPSCGHEPAHLGGFVSFAPDLAFENSGLNPEDHHVLDRVQHGSFWFRARNRLLQDLSRRWFSNAQTVLEVGCGTGYVLAGLRKILPNARLAGSEIYANGLEYAAKRLGDAVDLYQMDARAIPFSAEFDLIAACDVLEHIEADESVLSEMHRALKPGGGALLTVPQHPFLWNRWDEIAFHKRRYRRNELQEKCSRAGFRIVAQTSFVSTLLPLMAAQRLTAAKRSGYNAEVEMALPYWLDRLLERALDLERSLIARDIRLPVGGSRVVVAMRD
jgi:ubiquinone/menaquinone biosynthesis C-methylase UbiE